MSNEELAERIRDGNESLIPQLWEQVERFISMLREYGYPPLDRETREMLDGTHPLYGVVS